MTPTNITLMTKQYAGAVGLDRSQASGVKLRFVGFGRFVSFNFGQVQFLRFVVVMVWSNSFGHLHLVMLIALKFFWIKLLDNIFYETYFWITFLDNFLK